MCLFRGIFCPRSFVYMLTVYRRKRLLGHKVLQIIQQTRCRPSTEKNITFEMLLIIDIVLGFVIFNVITYSLLIAELCLFWFGYQVKGLFEIYIIYIEIKYIEYTLAKCSQKSGPGFLKYIKKKFFFFFNE